MTTPGEPSLGSRMQDFVGGVRAGHRQATGRGGRASAAAPSSRVRVDSTEISTLRSTLKSTASEAKNLANALKDVRAHLDAIGRSPGARAGGGGAAGIRNFMGGTVPGSAHDAVLLGGGGGGGSGSYLPTAGATQARTGGGSSSSYLPSRPAPAAPPSAPVSPGAGGIGRLGSIVGGTAALAASVARAGGSYLSGHLDEDIARNYASQNLSILNGGGSSYDALQRTSRSFNNRLQGNLGYQDVTAGMQNITRMGGGRAGGFQNQLVSNANALTSLDPTLGQGRATAGLASMTSVGGFLAGRSAGIDMRPGRSIDAIFSDVAARSGIRFPGGKKTDAQLSLAQQDGSRLNHNLRYLGLNDDMIQEFVRWGLNKNQGGNAGLQGGLAGSAQRVAQSQGNRDTGVDASLNSGVETAMGIRTAGNNALAGVARSPLGGLFTGLMGALGGLQGSINILTGVLGARGVLGILGRLVPGLGGGAGGGLLGGLLGGVRSGAGALARGAGTVARGALRVVGLGGAAVTAGVAAGGAAILGGLQQGAQKDLNAGALARGSKQGRQHRGSHWWDTRRYDSWKEQTAHNLFGWIPGVGNAVDSGTGYKYDKLSSDHLKGEHTTPVKDCPLCEKAAETGDGPGAPVGTSGVTWPTLEAMANGGPSSRPTSTTGGGHAKNSYHYKGQAVDFAGQRPSRDSKELLAINKYFAQKYGSGLKELIYAGPGGVNLKDGKPFQYSKSIMDEHHDHVHVAATPDSLKNTGGVPAGASAGASTTAMSSSGGKTVSSASSGSVSSKGAGVNFSFGSMNSADFLAGLLSGGSTPGTNQGGQRAVGGGASAGGGAGGSTMAPTTAPKGNVAGWIAAALGVLGKDSSFTNGLNHLIMAESGGNPRAQNNSDINARNGTPSKGLMQTIDSTFKAYMLPGHGDIWNPVDNIIAGFRYAEKNYGDGMIRAGGRKDARGNYIGYSRGNYEMVSDEIARLHKGEMVLTKTDAERMRGIAQGGNGMTGGRTQVHINNGRWTFQVASATADEGRKFAQGFMDELERDERVTSMANGG